MNTATRHILLIDSDRETQNRVNSYFDTEIVFIYTFSSAIGAIQHIKASKPADVLIIDENAKPMGAAQTLNYLNDELQFKSKAFVCSESNTHFETESGVYEVLKKPLDEVEFDKVGQALGYLKESENDLYSLKYLQELSEGDSNFIHQSIQMFLETVAPRIAEIRSLLPVKDYQKMSEIAHNIKPSFEMILNKRGAELCNFLAHQNEQQDFERHVDELYTEYVRVESRLRNDFLFKKT